MKYVTCALCGAVEYGNMTCRECVSHWPALGINQEMVDRLLAAIGDKPPVSPADREDVEKFIARLADQADEPAAAP